MILSAWPSSINSKFYAYNSKPKSNTETQEFSSGRVIAWQKNTKKQFLINCKVMLTAEELPIFWAWYNDILGQNAGAFSCEALGDKYYRFTETPEPEDTDTQYRVLTLNIEEVA